MTTTIDQPTTTSDERKAAVSDVVAQLKAALAHADEVCRAHRAAHNEVARLRQLLRDVLLQVGIDNAMLQQLGDEIPF